MSIQDLSRLARWPEAKRFWSKKLNPSHIEEVNWDSIGKAMKESPLYVQWFVSKHAVGICGVGNFLKRWKERDMDACPRCGAPEDARYIWRCPADSVKAIWKIQLRWLQEWGIAHDADPRLMNIMLLGLRYWYNPSHLLDNLDHEDSDFYHLEEVIGWDSFIEGFQHNLWQDIQQQYYELRGSRRTGKRWCIGLIKSYGGYWDSYWKPETTITIVLPTAVQIMNNG